ncbi:hypothetical protein BK120_23450 [Paenibacillus sp. FSL A5-0031]|uniref:stage II sporulation protein P n=1 Tax=Paenibacillus sp. FSL A5-0031 TaxID=1920420 RepID=UPI00096CE13A|nr:stage II sporulation protein P [Paenibacillus sp. FSL A5-0031]OME78696.1 hypothetical protein BK120_23450 [Paenibacillus sp. FSL A5-0031]
MSHIRSYLISFAFLFSATYVISNGIMTTKASNPSIEEIQPRQEIKSIKNEIVKGEKEVSMIINDNKRTTITKKETLSSTSFENLPQIIIYHSHNRESWITELDNIKTADEAFDEKLNVTLLGSYLRNKLLSSEIPVIHSKIDYPTRINNFNYAKSYSYSKKTIIQELKMHENTKYLLDLHRDSQNRDKTTIQYKNQNYAQVYFVVGTDHLNWEKNMKFASRIQEGLNKKVPNLSKGIYQKDKTSGNGEYNQSLSSNSALIEIGGVENSLEESYRTIEVLAAVIQDIWLEDSSRSSKNSSPSI